VLAGAWLVLGHELVADDAEGGSGDACAGVGGVLVLEKLADTLDARQRGWPR